MLVPLDIPAGLNSDDSTFAAQGRWADGNNVRFYNGKPQVVGAFEAIFTNSSLPFPRRILPFMRSGSISIAYAGDDGSGGTPKLYVGSGLASPTDRTPASLGTHHNWSLAAWGSTLLACPEGGTLYEQSGTSTAAAVAAAPDAITFMLVSPERQVIALGCNEEVSGTFNGLCIRWSDIEDYTDWTTAASGNAGEHILDGSGSIIGGIYVGPYLIVFTTADMFIGTFVGDPGQTFRFDPIERDYGGLAGPNACIVVGGALYWMGQDRRIRRWVPGGKPETLPCPIFIDHHGGIPSNSLRYVAASGNGKFNEVRFDYRGGGATAYPTGTGGSGNGSYVSLCLADGSWYRGAGAASAIGDYGSLNSLGASAKSTIIGSQSSGEIGFYDTSTIFSWAAGAAASQLAPYIKSADQYLDKSQRRMMIRSFIPDFERYSGSDLELTLYVRDRPQSAATEKGPHAITTSTTKKDFRASGKIVAMKLGASAAGSGSANFRLGKPLFDMIPMGER